jgi:hypothetical protein
MTWCDLQVSLLGHSAGAQLCMMALLNRAQAAHEQLQSTSGDSSSTCSSTMQQHNKQQLQPGGRPVMPQQFLGVTGVYDIAKHYAYEKDRGVHELSTMKRAMGGFSGFAAMSPAVILGAALQRQRLYSQEQQQEQQQQQQQRSVYSKQTQGQQQQQQQEPQDLSQPTDPAACAFYSSFQLSGEAIAHRIGKLCEISAAILTRTSAPPGPPARQSCQPQLCYVGCCWLGLTCLSTAHSNKQLTSSL